MKKKFSQKKYFVSIGRLTYQKNFLFLIQCLRKILKEEKNYIFVIIGEGQDRKKIEGYIKRFRLFNRIILTGYKKNIFKYVGNSEGLICSSLWEEPGFIIQEAAACKKIILTSDCYTGPSEFLNHGKNGYVFKNNNQKSFIKNFKKLLKEKKYHKKKIFENYKKTKLYTCNYFSSEIKKILN
ncbi:glycosyltransferase [Pelagibacterales bacterium SAG-MED30]|nr:glycosyltransferase [Pelagibacterales bacterium SAG-MED30]